MLNSSLNSILVNQKKLYEMYSLIKGVPFYFVVINCYCITIPVHYVSVYLSVMFIHSCNLYLIFLLKEYYIQ